MFFPFTHLQHAASCQQCTSFYPCRSTHRRKVRLASLKLKSSHILHRDFQYVDQDSNDSLVSVFQKSLHDLKVEVLVLFDIMTTITPCNFASNHLVSLLSLFSRCISRFVIYQSRVALCLQVFFSISCNYVRPCVSKA